MDMAFLKRTERMLGRSEPAPLDHALFVAGLSAGRTRPPCPTARAAPVEEPLVDLLLGGEGSRRAAAAQRGCFNRAEAGRRRNAP